VITGYIEREAIAVAGLRDGVLVPLVKFGLVAKGLWRRLDQLRTGPSMRSGLVPVRPELVAGVKFFGRYQKRLDPRRRAAVGRLITQQRSTRNYFSELARLRDVGAFPLGTLWDQAGFWRVDQRQELPRGEFRWQIPFPLHPHRSPPGKKLGPGATIDRLDAR